jgi:hypothetical protein
MTQNIRDEKSKSTPPLPHPDVFKKWLKRCIFDLETNAVKVSRRADLGVNTAGSFLREDRDITLGVAGKLHAAVFAISSETGKPLPTYEEVCPNV